MLSKKGFEMFRKETEQVLQEIAKKYDVNIHAGHISYDSNHFELKLEVTKKEINGKSYEQTEFEKECIYYGLNRTL